MALEALAGAIPGATIAVGPPDGVILTGAAGLADRRTGRAMTPEAGIHAASTTKAVTAVAILRLVDRGRLTIEARLTELLPAEVLAGIPYAEEITVRHLLVHTSGLYSPNNDPVYLARYIGPQREEKPFWRPEEIVAFAADPGNPPFFAPGEGTRYGDINYVLLGLIVEAVAGEPLAQFVAREILRPLGMSGTYYLSEEPSRERARAYTVDSEILRSIGLDPALVADSEGFVDTTDAQERSDAAAGLISTAADLVRFARGVVDGRLLAPDSRGLVLEVAERPPSPESSEALEVLRSYRKPYGVIVTAEGDGPGTNVVWAWHPPSNCVVAAAVNQFGRWDENDLLLDVVIPGALEAVDPCSPGDS